MHYKNMGNVIQKLVYPGKKVPRAREVLVSNGYDVSDICAIRSPALSSKVNDVTLVCFHGNLEDVSQSSPMWDRVHTGCVIAFEYAGYGWRHGKDASQGAFLNDVSAQCAVVRKYALAGTKIVIVGRSLGSFAALNLAIALGSDSCAAVVLISPLLSAVATQIPPPFHRPFAFMDLADNGSLARDLDENIPVFIAYGDSDIIVPPSNGVALWNALPLKCRHTRLVVEYADHGTILHASALWTGIEEFIKLI
jgi:pimeloyl-ACP methyl ester carboxylesterase